MLVDGKQQRFQFLSETYTVSTEEACRLLPGDNVFLWNTVSLAILRLSATVCKFTAGRPARWIIPFWQPAYPFTFIYTCIFFLWQTNSAAAAAAISCNGNFVQVMLCSGAISQSPEQQRHALVHTAVARGRRRRPH